MKIANRITISFMSVILLIGFSAGSVIYFLSRRYLKELITKDLIAVTRARGKHIETYLAMVKATVNQLAQGIELEEFLDNRSNPVFVKNALEILERSKSVNPAVLDFMVLDTHGTIVAATDEHVIGQDKSTAAFFVGAQKGIFIKDAYITESARGAFLEISVPIADSATGALRGIVAAKVDFTDLNKIITDVNWLGNTGELYLVNRYCYMITPSRFFSHALLTQRIDSAIVREFTTLQNRRLAFKPHPRIYANYRGVEVLGHLEYIPEMQWFLVAEQDTHEAFAPVEYLRMWLVLIVITGVGAACAASLWIARSISRPIRALQVGAERIEKGDLDFKVATTANDEIGQLSRSFDLMIASLKYSIASIDMLNKEIGSREQTEKLLMSAYEQLKNAQAKLIQSSKMAAIGQLASGVAQEINNPLTEILRNLRLIKQQVQEKKELKGADVQAILGAIEESALRCKKVTRYLVDMFNATTGELKPLNVNSVIDNVANMVAPELEASNIAFKKAVQPDVASVNGDFQLLEQAILGLVDNAKHAINSKPDKTGGTITLATWQEPGSKIVAIACSDDGIGIPEDNLAKIFDPLFTTKDLSEAGGLGLALIFNIIRSHNGSIVVDSKINVGTTFKIYLPYA